MKEKIWLRRTKMRDFLCEEAADVDNLYKSSRSDEHDSVDQIILLPAAAVEGQATAGQKVVTDKRQPSEELL